MNILAIDSSGMTASAAIVDDEKVIAEFTVNNKKTHSQTLLPMIEQVVQMSGLAMQQIDAIAVAGGPGSFTGLRIGSATAKGIGLALDKPLVHIPTLEAMAYSGYGFSGLVCPMMDARRNQVYTGIYSTDRQKQVMAPQTEQMALPVEEIIAMLNAQGEAVLLLGDGADAYKEVLTEKLSIPYLFAPSYMSRQRAAMVGYAALEYVRSGRTESAEAHRPDYLRVSQAERERAERQSAEKKV